MKLDKDVIAKLRYAKNGLMDMSWMLDLDERDKKLYKRYVITALDAIDDAIAGKVKFKK